MLDTAWEKACEAFDIEADAILQAKSHIDRLQFGRAVDVLSRAQRIGVSGCGHSGIACMHFAHSLCCIERPARFLSPAEAVHGATGFLQQGDVMVLASRGGKTSELLPIIRICKQKNVTIIGITENMLSPLALETDLALRMHITRETDRYNMQGTTSFVVLSAIFDALQTALVEQTHYQKEQFALVHPGGAVGERLNRDKI